MKAVIFPCPGKYEIKEIEIPEIGDNEVLLKNKYAGFCGTDLKIFKGDYVTVFPLIPGHEFSGTVETIGKNVSSFSVGQRVAVEHTIACGNCYYCKRNEQNLCIRRGSFGTTANGGFAEYTKIPEFHLHYLSDKITFKEAALQEPLACAIFAIEKINIRPGDRALMFGAGATGLILLQLLSIRGVSNITVVDVYEEKLETAEKFGATQTFINDSNLENKLKALSEYNFDIVIDATGIASVCENTFKYINKNGRILFFGLCNDKERVCISPYQVTKNDLSIFGSFSFKRNTAQALELLANKKIDLEGLISHEFRLDDFGMAFDLAKSGKFTKIIFNCSSD